MVLWPALDTKEATESSGRQRDGHIPCHLYQLPAMTVNELVSNSEHRTRGILSRKRRPGKLSSTRQICNVGDYEKFGGISILIEDRSLER